MGCASQRRNFWGGLGSKGRLGCSSGHLRFWYYPELTIISHRRLIVYLCCVLGSPTFPDPSETVGAKATLNGSNNPAGSFVSKEVADPVNAVGSSVFTNESGTVGESAGSFLVPSGRFDAESA